MYDSGSRRVLEARSAGSIPATQTKFCAIGCNGVWFASTLNAQGFLAWVRIPHGAPSFVSVSKYSHAIKVSSKD